MPRATRKTGGYAKPVGTALSFARPDVAQAIAQVEQDCQSLQLGDVARLRARAKAQGIQQPERLGKVQLCTLLGAHPKQSFTYADIQVKDAPHFAVCPVTKKIMVRPATLSTGTTLEHSAAVSLLAQDDPKDPLSGVAVDEGILVDNRNLALAIRSWAEQHFSLNGREIDPESPQTVAERKKQEADEKERGVNVGSVTRTDVNYAFASMNRNNNVYRGVQVWFEEGAYFSARWDFGGGDGELADELHLVRDGAKWISAVWGGIDERWEMSRLSGRGDMVKTVGTGSELKTLLAFLADKGAIRQMNYYTSTGRVFAKASWPDAEWAALTPQSLDYGFKTVKLVARHISVDSMEYLVQVPDMVWNHLIDEGVVFIEKMYDGWWYIRSLFSRVPERLLDDSHQIVGSAQLLDILRAMRNANVLDLVILNAPPTFVSTDLRDDYNASLREQVRVNLRVAERVAQERLRANDHADGDIDDDDDDDEDDSRPARVSADSDDAKSNVSDDADDVDRRRGVRISEVLREEELRLLARNTGPVTPADVDETFARLGADQVYRRLTVQFVDDAFFSSRWAEEGRTLELDHMLSLLIRGVSAQSHSMSALWLHESDRWEITSGQHTMGANGRMLMELLKFLAAKHTIASFRSDPMGDAVAFEKDSWSEAVWDTITSERLLELGTIMLVLSAVADDAVQPAAVPDEIWNVVTAGERVFFLYYSAAAAAPASAAVDGGGRWLLRRPASMATQPLAEIVREEPLALLDALHRLGFIDVLVLGAPVVF